MTPPSVDFHRGSELSQLYPTPGFSLSDTEVSLVPKLQQSQPYWGCIIFSSSRKRTICEGAKFVLLHFFAKISHIKIIFWTMKTAKYVFCLFGSPYQDSNSQSLDRQAATQNLPLIWGQQVILTFWNIRSFNQNEYF